MKPAPALISAIPEHKTREMNSVFLNLSFNYKRMIGTALAFKTRFAPAIISSSCFLIYITELKKHEPEVKKKILIKIPPIGHIEQCSPFGGEVIQLSIYLLKIVFTFGDSCNKVVLKACSF